MCIRDRGIEHAADHQTIFGLLYLPGNSVSGNALRPTQDGAFHQHPLGNDGLTGIDDGDGLIACLLYTSFHPWWYFRIRLPL